MQSRQKIPNNNGQRQPKRDHVGLIKSCETWAGLATYRLHNDVSGIELNLDSITAIVIRTYTQKETTKTFEDGITFMRNRMVMMSRVVTEYAVSRASLAEIWS